MHKIILVLLTAFLVAFNNEAFSQTTETPVTVGSVSQGGKDNISTTGNLLDNATSEKDTCIFYVNLTTPTNDFVGLVMNGTDLINAMLYTRCDCQAKAVKLQPGENFLMAAIHNNTLKLANNPGLAALKMVWVGNTTKFIISRKQ